MGIFRLANVDLLKSYSYKDGRLFKNSKMLKTVRNGHLLTTCEGKTYYAADIVWALYYGHVAQYPLWQFDPEPFNLAPGNLFPMRLSKLPRCQVKYKKDKNGRGFKHSLSSIYWVTEADARFNWRETVRDMLAAEKERCLLEGNKARSMFASESGFKLVTPIVDFPPYVGSTDFKTRPKSIPKSGKAHYYKGQWIIVNKAKCIADDFMLRCDAALKFIRGEETHWDSLPVCRHKAMTENSLPI